MMRMARVLAHGAIVVAVSTTTTGCKRTMDPDSIETTIEKMLAEKGVTAKATCPSGQEVKAGASFTCTAVEGSNPPLEFTVDLQDDEGKFYVKLVGTLVEASLIETNLKGSNPDANVKCAWKAKALKKDETVTCELSGVEGMKQLKITMVDADKGVVKYDPIP